MTTNFQSLKPLYSFHGSAISFNNKIRVLDYLAGSHYCSCCCHIQASPSKMHQGVIAFVFCLAKVFINVLRKRQKEYFTYAVWAMELTVCNWSVSFRSASCLTFYEQNFHFIFVINVWQIYLDLVCPSDKFPVENHSTISVPLLILCQPGYRKKSQMCTSSSTLTIQFLSIKAERFSTAVKDDAC